MKLDPKGIRYLTAEDWRVLTAVWGVLDVLGGASTVLMALRTGRDGEQKP